MAPIERYPARAGAWEKNGGVPGGPENKAKVFQAAEIFPEKAGPHLDPGDTAKFDAWRMADEVIVDLISLASGIDYAAAASEVVGREVVGVAIPFASPLLLGRMKRHPHRVKDAPDLLFLRQLLEAQGITPPEWPGSRKFATNRAGRLFSGPMYRFLVSLLAIVFTLGVSATHAAPPPNVVLIISDDQAWGDFGFMGHPQVRTPHLDKLAAQSLLFPRGYVPSSLCCPSLASIITGRYPHQNGITSNDPALPPTVKGREKAQHPLFREGRRTMNGFMERAATLPRVLGERGYLSFQTGKWWQGHFKSGGFTHGMSLGEEGKGGRHGDAGLKIGRQGMEPIYEFIGTAQAEKKPFLVWYAPMLPHDPHTAPDRILEKYKPLTPSLHVAKYWANIEWFDETVGQLLEHLEKQGLAENTIVAFVTDNGWIQSTDSPKYAPKSKQSPYDGGLRTPIMLKWPGKITPRKSEALASSLDLYPTLLTALGVKPSADMPGLNLLDDAAVAQRQQIFGECFTHDAQDLVNPAASLRWRWMIDGHTKLIVPAAQNEPNEKVELYDLATDPKEEKNLAAAQPERVAELTKKIDAWWPGTKP